MLLGCFVENNARSGYLEGAIRQAVECDANCFMFYLGSPQTTIRAGIDKFNIPEFKNELKENKIDIEHVFVHAPYIINPASNDPKKQKFAVSFLTEECLRCEKIGVKYLILHPGNAIENIGLDTAISNCANIINKIHKKTSVAICIETMSGKGSEIGRDFKEIKRIIDLVEEKDKIGVCLDTCHV
jgi:deoxyribonuclease-4